MFDLTGGKFAKIGPVYRKNPLAARHPEPVAVIGLNCKNVIVKQAVAWR